MTQTGVPGEELSTEHAAHAVGRHDDVGAQLARRRTRDHGTPGVLHPGHRYAELYDTGRQGGGEGVDQEAAVHGTRGKPVPGGRGTGVGPAQPPAVGGTQPDSPGQGITRPHLGAQADRVQGAQGVGGEHDPGADTGEDRSPFAHGHAPSATVQGHRSGQTPDTAPGHDSMTNTHTDRLPHPHPLYTCREDNALALYTCRVRGCPSPIAET